jgi:PAS domain S-box-containing protein
MHRVLARQLRRHFGDEIPDHPAIRALLDDVDAAYREADTGRALLERSLELTSAELYERNQALHEAMSGGNIGTWVAYRGGRLLLQGFPLPCVPDGRRRVMTTCDAFLASLDASDRGPVGAALAGALPDGSAVRFWVSDERGRRWLELRGRRASSGDGQVGICADVSAEHAAEEQRQLLRAVIDTAPNFIFAKDRDGRYTLVNTAVADFFGREPDELLGTRDADLLSDPGDLERLRDDDAAVFESLVERHLPEEKVTDAKGRARWFQTVKRPLLGEDGKARQVLAVATDITERRLAEEERIKLEDNLRQAQRLESLGLLAGGVAHDFNNQLTPILIYAEMIGELVDSDQETRECVSEICAAAGRARDLTAQLLAFGRKQTLVMARLDLNGEIAELRAMLLRVMPENIELLLDLERDLPAVCADRVQVHQILMNLAANARDAMPTGGRLRFATRSENDGKLVVLTITDTGHGMDPATKSQIFEPFFTTKSLGKGTGLGLATVYGAVRQHAGTIDVESTPGAGTVFVIRLPADPTSGVVEKSTTVSSREPRMGTVLVVEDEPRILNLTSTLLRRRGLEVLTAANGDQALALASSHPGRIDVLLTDVVMPGMNGPELHDRLRVIRDAVEDVFMTGYAHDVHGDHDGRVDRETRVLRKPFTSVDLLDCVDDALGRATAATSESSRCYAGLTLVR